MGDLILDPKYRAKANALAHKWGASVDDYQAFIAHPTVKAPADHSGLICLALAMLPVAASLLALITGWR